MEYKDYYAILGIAENATKKEIRQAYIKLVRTYHPDKRYSTADWKKVNEEFSNIVEAYEVLIDDREREKYDAYLKNLKAGKLKEKDKKKEHAFKMYKFGLAAYKKGEKERAKGYFKASVQFDASSSLYKSYYGLLLIETNEDKVRGWSEIKEAFASSMDNKDVIINFSKASILMEKEEEAFNVLKNALKWFPNDKILISLYNDIEKIIKKRNNPLLKLFRRK